MERNPDQLRLPLSPVIDLPEIGQTVIVAGGTIFRRDEQRFIAYDEQEVVRYRTTLDSAMPIEASFRSAENTLRRRARLPIKPKLCAVCLVEHHGHGSCCSRDCTTIKVRRAAEASAYSLHYTTAELIAHAQAVAAERISREEGDETVYVRSVVGHAISEPAKFREAGKRADALIRRRGGIVPRRASFDSYLAQYEAGTYQPPQPVTATAAPTEQSA